MKRCYASNPKAAAGMGFALLTGLIAMSYAAAAATFTIKDGVSDWTVSESYNEGAVPGENDIVQIPADFTVGVSNETSFAKISTLTNIQPMSATSTIVFDVAEGAVRTNASAIRGTSSSYGVIVKRGKGELNFTSVERYLSGQSCTDYRVGQIIVEEGILRMKESAPKREYAYNTLVISNNATFVLPTRGSTGGSSFFCLCNYLRGEGAVYCRAATELRIAGTEEQTFAGSYTGAASYFASGRVMLTGTNSTTAAAMSAYSSTSKMPGGTGVTGVKKFGRAGEPSSIGTANTFSSNYKGGGFLYLGEGETTDKGLRVKRGGLDGGPSFLDAGAHGGLKFQGIAWAQTESNRRLEPLYLYGSNTAPCTIASPVNNWTYGTTNLAFHLVKRGTGAWRMANCTNDQVFAGGISVEEGTFQFDSIGAKGQYSAVGTSARLFQPVLATYNPEYAVDYAFALGMTNASGAATTEGTFEYTGTNSTLVWSRPLVLKGHGRIKNDTAKNFRFRGISALGAGEHTLTLDGTGIGTNEIADITDGRGTVSVVKTGAGNWTISGTNTFSGDLDVQGGRLTVRNVTATNYTWFLWTVKQLCHPTIKATNNEFKVPEFGMFDAVSNQVVKGLTFTENYAEMSAGQTAMLSGSRPNYNGSSRPSSLFNGSVNNDGGLDILNNRNGGYYTMSVTDPTTWIPVIFRMKDGAGIVASYDIATMHGATASNGNGGMSPRTFTLEGSVDGLHWDMLDDVEDTLAWDDWSKNGGMLLPQNKGAWFWGWMYTTNTAATGYTQVHAGKPIRGTTDVVYPMLTNVRSVSVSGGAVLAVDGDSIELSSLSVDCAGGGGTISNFTFAASGRLTVANATKDRMQRLPLNLAHSANVAALANWTFAADESCAAKTYLLRMMGNDVYLMRPGTIISFR